MGERNCHDCDTPLTDGVEQCPFCKGFDYGMREVFFVLMRHGAFSQSTLRSYVAQSVKDEAILAALDKAVSQIKNLEKSDAK